jgi:hypothetical protein
MVINAEYRVDGLMDRCLGRTNTGRPGSFVGAQAYLYLMSTSCPACRKPYSLREVIYGLPDGPQDESKYVTGGCCISENDPMTICLNCGWEGDFVNNLETLGTTDLSI